MISEFKDIFDVDHFITSLRDEVRILKELPPRVQHRVDRGMFLSMQPISWSDISYYAHQVSCLSIKDGISFAILVLFAICCIASNFCCHCYQILPLVQKHKVVQLNKTDARLANNILPSEIQKLRCRVNFNALKFTSQIEELGRRVVKILREKGPFLVLHLRYEMDMLAFSGCTHGCNSDEEEELTRMRYAVSLFCHSHNYKFFHLFTNYSKSGIIRYAYPWWKEKVINSEMKRKEGLCPLTPEETALVLRALGIDCNVQIYIAAGEIYGGERRMAPLAEAFPNVVSKMYVWHLQCMLYMI